ncbi:hypothetical protein ALC53_06113 [Atta colombica]|uniref:Uncharacterized protein n=1 Tax=Atta colombica TaxID=520822 RepID=A0A195BGN3_9HYME|nr:hypothetical protein ALC53_06113 [Atta colombica]
METTLSVVTMECVNSGVETLKGAEMGKRVADHTVVSPRTRDNERNWRLWSQEELGISSRRAAEYNTRAYNDVGLTIAYSRAETNGIDRVNAPVYHREDNKQEYANITNDLCLRPPSRGERKVPTVSLFPGTREYFNDQKRRASRGIFITEKNTTTRALNYDTRNEFLPPSEWLTALSPGRAQQGAPAPDPKDVTRNEHTLRIFSGRLIDKRGKVLLVVRLEPARRMPRRKTADLYFFVEGAAGWPVHELRAVCVPYTGCVFLKVFMTSNKIIKMAKLVLTLAKIASI